MDIRKNELNFKETLQRIIVENSGELDVNKILVPLAIGYLAQVIEKGLDLFFNGSTNTQRPQ